jgi:hypothetical protein
MPGVLIRSECKCVGIEIAASVDLRLLICAIELRFVIADHRTLVIERRHPERSEAVLQPERNEARWVPDQTFSGSQL